MTPEQGNGWYARVCTDGRIICGGTEIFLGQPGNWQSLGPGIGPYQLGPTSFVFGDHADFTVVMSTDGTRHTVPLGYGVKVTSDQTDRWIGCRASNPAKIDEYLGATLVKSWPSDVWFKAMSPDGTRAAYVDQPASQIKALYLNGTKVATGIITSASLTDTAMCWSEAGDHYSKATYGFREGGPIEKWNICDWEEPQLVDGPDGELWLLSAGGPDPAGLILYPQGSVFGYRLDGNFMFPHGRYVGGKFIIASSSPNGVIQVDTIDPTTARVDLTPPPPPPPPEPIGPRSEPLPEGTEIDLTPFFTYDPAVWPRGGNKTNGDDHAYDMQPVIHKGEPCIWHAVFNDGKGRLGSLVQIKDGFLHLLSDCHNRDNTGHPDGPFIDTWNETRWIPLKMRIGRKYGWTAPDHVIRKHREDGTIFKEYGSSREHWIQDVWPKFWCGPDLGMRMVVRFAQNNTGIKAGHTTTIAGLGMESDYLVFGAGRCRWTYDRAMDVFVGPNHAPIFPDQSQGQSDFWHVGGPRYTPDIPPWIPLATVLPDEVPPVTPPPPPPPEIPPVTPPPNYGHPVLDVDLIKGGTFDRMSDAGYNLIVLQPQFDALVTEAKAWHQRATGVPPNAETLRMMIDIRCVAERYRWVSPRGAWLNLLPSGDPNPTPPPTPVPPVPPGGVTPDMKAWPKFGASYNAGMTNPSCDPALWAALNRDAGGNITRVNTIDAWAVAPNGPGQYSGFMPWLRDGAGVFDLAAPDPRWDERLNAYVRAQNHAGVTVQLTVFDLYSWSERKQGLLWVPDQNLGPFRRNKNGVRWGNPDDPTFLALPDWVMLQHIQRICASVKGLAVCFETGNEMPEKDMHIRIAQALRSHFTADWSPDITTNRQEDTSGQYFNMKIGTNFDRIAFHGKDSLAYLDEVFEDEPSSRPNTFRKLFEQPWSEGPVDPKRIIMSSDGCRVNSTMDCYDWPRLAEVFKDHIRRGFTVEHQSRVKMQPFLEGKLELQKYFEGDWLRSVRA